MIPKPTLPKADTIKGMKLFLQLCIFIYENNICIYNCIYIMCDIMQKNSCSELRLTLAYNKSDATFGWNGFNNAMMLYFMSHQETFVHRDHGYPLVDGLRELLFIFMFLVSVIIFN